MPDIERKQQKTSPEKQAEQQIADHRQCGLFPPQRTQPVIDQSQSDRQQRRQSKLKRLKENRQLHQPNSRASSPPAGASSS